MPTSDAGARQSILVRAGLALIGGYALAAGLCALSTVLFGPSLGRGEAYQLSMLLGFLVFPGAVLWCFAERRLARVAVVLPGGAFAAFALAHLLAH